MTQKNLAIIIAGAGACGKTTTTNAFAMGEPEEHKEEMPCLMRNGWEPRDVSWVIWDNSGVAGNIKSTTDANIGPGVVRNAFNKCLERRRVVIVDGYMSSPQWVDMCNDWDEEHYPDEELVVLILEFILKPEELLERLAERRGVDKEEIREKMYPKMEANTGRPKTLLKHFNNKCELEMHHVVVYVDDSTDEIVDLMDEAVADIMGWEDWPYNFQEVQKDAVEARTG